MTIRHLATFTCLALALAGGVRASASDAELLAGIAKVKAGDYSGGILTLDRVVQRLSTQKAAFEDLGPAYLYLGIAYVALGNETRGRSKFQQAFVHAQLAGLAPDHLSIDATFPPRVIEVFEEVRKGAAGPPSVARPAVATQPVAAPSPQAAPTSSPSAGKKGRSKAPLILGGIALAGGAAVVGAAVAGGGDSAASGSGPASAPAPTQGITLLSLTPSSGGTVRAGDCLSGGCLQQLTVRYQVLSSRSLPGAEVESEFFAGGRRCMYGFTSNVDVIAGQQQTFQDNFFVVECSLPFTVTSLKATLYDTQYTPNLEQSFNVTLNVTF